jgi:hypothetical protein
MDRQQQHGGRRSRAHLTRLRRKAHTTVPLNDLPSSWRFATKSPVPSPRASLRRRQQGRRQLCRRPFFKRCTVQFGRSTQLRLRQRINKFRNRRARVETSAGAGAPAVGGFDRRARRSRREPSGRLSVSSPRGRDSRARDSQGIEVNQAGIGAGIIGIFVRASDPTNVVSQLFVWAQI